MTDETPDTQDVAPADADTQQTEPESVDTEAQASDEGSTDTSDSDIESTGDADTEPDTTPDEAEKSKWRQADYTRKAQELAEQRKAYEAERAEFAKVRDTRLQQADQAIKLAAATLQHDIAQIDWTALARENPAEYVAKQHEVSQRQAQLNAAWQAVQSETAEKDRETTQAKAKRLSEQQAKLIEAIPEWKDEARRAAESTKIANFAKSLGASDDALNYISNEGEAWMVQVLRDASRYREMQSKLPKAKPITAAPPPPPKITAKAPATKDPDKMPIAEWVKWRESQLKRNAAR